MMVKIVKVKARVKPVTDKPTYEEVRQELRCMEQDYDNLLMDYEDLNRDYEKEVNKNAELEAQIRNLKAKIYDLLGGTKSGKVVS